MSVSDDDKVSIINNHIRNIELTKYTSEIMLMTQQAISSPDQRLIDMYTAQIADANLQLSILAEQKNSLTPKE